MTDYTASIIIFVAINVVAVLGVSILLGFTGVFTFGHTAYMAIGGYASALSSIKLGLPVPVSMSLGMLAAMLIAIPIGYPTLRLRGDYFIIGSLGAAEAIRLILVNLDWITGGARGLPGIPVAIGVNEAIILMVGSIFLTRNFITSKYGRNCVAVRENELAAQCIGIDPLMTKMKALLIAAALGGLSGSMMAHYVGVLSPSMFNILRSADLTIMVILGGMGSITGSVLAAATLTALPEILRPFAEYRLIFYGLAVIIIMITRPNGLLGYTELSKDSIIQLYHRVIKVIKNRS